MAPQCLMYFVFGVLTATSHASVSVWNSVITEKNHGNFAVFPNYLYKDSYVSVTVVCKSDDPALQVSVIWLLVEMNCMQDMYNPKPEKQSSLLSFMNQDKLNQAPLWTASEPPYDVNYTTIRFQVSLSKEYSCGDEHILTLLDESDYSWYIAQVPNNHTKVNSSDVKFWRIQRVMYLDNSTQLNHRVSRTWTSGMFHYLLSIVPQKFNGKFQAKLYVEMKSRYGYLPAISFPLLPYSAVTSVLYLLLGTVWMVIWVRAQQHTTKIHMVISVVTVAGGVTNTLMFIQQASVNSSGQGFPALDWIALILTHIQASLTTMLLMVVSTGHGITRPTLHKKHVAGIVVLTCLRFLVSLSVMIVTDETLRIQYKVPGLALVVAAVYGVVMLVIGGFIMVQAILTAVHLWDRKHSHQIVFFSIFMVASILGFIAEIFLLGIGYGWFSSCRQDWQDEWIFNNFGSVITFVLLVVLMWLWRPVDITQSYSFFPLDTGDKDTAVLDDEDEETEIFSRNLNSEP